MMRGADTYKKTLMCGVVGIEKSERAASLSYRTYPISSKSIKMGDYRT